MANYLSDNQTRFLDELLDWLRIPSVSADPKFHADILKAADSSGALLRSTKAKALSR